MSDIVGRATTALEQAGWRSDMESAPRDGEEILICAHGMVVQARYHPGEWSEDTPINPAEYSGALWVAFDDAMQFEIEEGAGPEGNDFHAPVTHWKPLDTPDQPDPLAAVAAELLEEVKRLREALRRTENSLTASIEVIEKHVPSDALGINSSGDMEESHLTWSWPILDEFLHYVKIDRDAARALLPEVTP